jgi:hypothetical protein
MWRQLQKLGDFGSCPSNFEDALVVSRWKQARVLQRYRVDMMPGGKPFGIRTTLLQPILALPAFPVSDTSLQTRRAS